MARSNNDTTTDVCSTTAETNVDKDSSMTADVITVRQRLKRKLDMRFVVWAFLGFFAGNLDRSNLRLGKISNVGMGCGAIVAVLLSWFLLRIKFMLPSHIKPTEQRDDPEKHQAND
ncbi:predicted protein [Lichtheimia corymbifera JMRC:FSU:9682]|uniref:Uncharacterized protein n=1 Tax=Lichtheimia corymbifera JMRC:FSU:9682 TaxID=1263082 RepID=A0A068RH95_9FUNG|nr:predicted protein [Lichtheimia corymbifera JMRC:FSU:9682]